MTRILLTATAAVAALATATPIMAHPGGGGGARGGGEAAAMKAGRDIENTAAANRGGLDRELSVMHGAGRDSMNTMNGRGQTSGADSVDTFNATRIPQNGSENAGSSIATRVRGSSDSTGFNGNPDGQLNSRAFMHASPTAIAHANEHSALARGAVSSSQLPGLTTGLSVQDSSGTSIGTISSVLTTRNGSIAGVIVTGTNGQTYRIPASSLAISGNIVTVANTEAYQRTGVPSAMLPGLTTGLNVNLTGGTSFGTVSQVITSNNGTVQAVVVTTSTGQTYTLPASSLTISGNTVTVNTAEAFENTGVPSSLLPGLTSGLTVNTAAGSTFGTVSQVNTGANGAITSVVVTTSTGQTYTVPASSLSISGNTVTVASASEAFEGTGVPSTFLPGLSTGLTVNSSGGASLGTISQVLTASNGSITGVVVMDANGQSYTLPAYDLTISGSTVIYSNIG